MEKSLPIIGAFARNKAIVKMAVPVFLELILSVAMGYVTQFLLTPIPLASNGVSQANQIANIFIVSFSVLSSSSLILLCQLVGKGDDESAKKIYPLSVYLNLLIGVIVALAVFGFSFFVFSWMGVKENVIPFAKAFLALTAPSFVFQALTNVFSAFLRANKRMVPPTAIAVEPSYDRATVTWEGSYESYTVACAEAGSEEWTEATATGNSYTIEGLKPETAYRLRLRSFNSETDFSQWSEEKAFTTTALPECVTPTDLAVAMPTATTATLSWTAGERNLSWTVNWRKSDASAWTAIEGLTATSCELTGLTEGTAYIWRVMAECELNESRWSSQNRFTAMPTAIGSTDITGVTAFVKDGTLNIVNPERGLIRSVRIYNAAGQLVAASSLETTDNVFMPLPACDGSVIIVKIDGDGCQRTIKTAI